jgi:hypothetical protein
MNQEDIPLCPQTPFQEQTSQMLYTVAYVPSLNKLSIRFTACLSNQMTPLDPAKLFEKYNDEKVGLCKITFNETLQQIFTSIFVFNDENEDQQLYKVSVLDSKYGLLNNVNLILTPKEKDFYVPWVVDKSRLTSHQLPDVLIGTITPIIAYPMVACENVYQNRVVNERHVPINERGNAVLNSYVINSENAIEWYTSMSKCKNFILINLSKDFHLQECFEATLHIDNFFLAAEEMVSRTHSFWISNMYLLEGLEGVHEDSHASMEIDEMTNLSGKSADNYLPKKTMTALTLMARSKGGVHYKAHTPLIKFLLPPIF